MRYLNKKYNVEVKDKRYSIHPEDNNILRERKQPKSLNTQYQVINETRIRKNQKNVENDSDQLEV